MANLKASKKNIRKIAKATERNRAVRSRIKTLKKRVQEVALSGDKEATKAVAISFVKTLDKAAKSSIIHRNKANRHKSKVAEYIFA